MYYFHYFQYYIYPEYFYIEKNLFRKFDYIHKKTKKKFMHKPGIEPGSIAWQATILPLDHLCISNILKIFFNLFIKINLYLFHLF